MYRVLFLITRKAGLTYQEFRDHYENIHIPLVLELSGDTLPLVYKRRYVIHESSKYVAHDVSGTHGHKTEFEFDVVTEVVFASKDAFEKWNFKIVEDGRMFADGIKHQDPSLLRMVVFEEEITRDELSKM